MLVSKQSEKAEELAIKNDRTCLDEAKVSKEEAGYEKVAVNAIVDHDVGQ